MTAKGPSEPASWHLDRAPLTGRRTLTPVPLAPVRPPHQQPPHLLRAAQGLLRAHQLSSLGLQLLPELLQQVTLLLQLGQDSVSRGAGVRGRGPRHPRTHLHL